MSDTFSIFILLNKNFKRTKIFCDIINVFTVTFDQCNASLLVLNGIDFTLIKKNLADLKLWHSSVLCVMGL